ncbi:uncharacterized protein A1O9_03121 [Exophiala aquamarina CBS 119918]|uniref:RNA helicase n=1 Tax=Exophiala aquamarina CBS 119918 TaxID=1182545 RepID=A0A072PN78_9EURO|nr:uncharacterized protein A1O9_03121 [Exophiala aquamarina CBS 119918]KEF61554.1 hypothetical protein A1O9_03121 [Exophiala aquamarina CBS 119918]
MAPQRKKKPAANPARGFATTSLPSRSKAIDEAEQSTSTGTTVSPPNGPSATNNNSQNGGKTLTQDNLLPNGASDIMKMTPEELEAHLENAELDSLLNKYAKRCITEANRQVTRLETERRQMRSQSVKLSTYGWLSGETADRLFDMVGKPRWKVKAPTSAPRDSVGDEKILADLWTLQRVLQVLNFPAVQEAISHITHLTVQGLLATHSDLIPGLLEAFEWYASQNQTDWLPNYEQAFPQRMEETGNSTLYQETSRPTSTTASRQSPARTPVSLSESEEDFSAASPASDSDDNLDPQAQVDRYIRIQTKIWRSLNPEPTRPQKGSSNEMRRRQRLNKKLEDIRRDILFESDMADSMWSEKLEDLQATHQRVLREQARLRREEARESSAVPDNAQEDKSSTDRELVIGEEARDDDEVLLGGIFGEVEEANPVDQQESQTQENIRVLDFGKWTGVSPRRLLEEICRGHDPKCRIQVQALQSTASSTRHNLTIAWNTAPRLPNHAVAALPTEVTMSMTPSVWTLIMNSLAAASKIQSEAYIASLALFLMSTLGSKEQKATSRLPTVWRDLLKELSDAKQDLANEEHKTTLRDLQATIKKTKDDLAQDMNQGVSVESAQQQAASDSRRRTHRPTAARLTAEQVLKEWTARTSRPAFARMLEIRQQLPVHSYKDVILDCVNNNAVSVICAETGAGKSSGIPVLLLEQDFIGGTDCRILVTQPRRISAITLARRVSQEIGEARNDIGTTRSLVGYAIRMESKTSSNTRITYATTGVLLRMLEESPDLEELDYLVLDEVHERTMDLDLLFIALRKLQQRRNTLKIILMSATVDAKKFSDYFGGAPVLDLPGRTFPVEVGYLEDAVEATNDLSTLKDRGLQGYEDGNDFEDYADEKGRPMLTSPEKYSKQTQQALAAMDERRIDYSLIAKVATAIATKPKYKKYSSAILIFMPGIAEMRRLHNILLNTDIFGRNWVIHLLHSTFSTEDLEKAFEIPPCGHRKIVIATNIAETGITIPDVTAVIDTCKEKVMRFDERRQSSRLTEGFISRSSARQRRGRAARVQDGLCFHLVTKHRHHNMMLEQQIPEMLRLGLQEPMLRIKVWDLGSIEETLAQAIDPPTRKNVLRAIEKLKDAGALTKNEKLTALGKQIAKLPLEVSLAKLAIFGAIFGCLEPVLTIIAFVTSKSPFRASPSKTLAEVLRVFARGHSDLLTLVKAYESWRRAKTARAGQEFCRKNHINDQVMSQVEDQKVQLLVYLVDAGVVAFEPEEKETLVRARSGSGRGGNFYTIPDRYDRIMCDRALCAIIAMALYPRVLAREGKSWRNVYSNQQVSLISHSINHGNPRAPRWLSFYEAMQSRTGSLNVFETSAIPDSALALLLGEAEFKFFAGVLNLDSGKVRLSVRHWRQLMAIKILRERMADVLDAAFKRPCDAMNAENWKWIDLWLSIEAAQDA